MTDRRDATRAEQRGRRVLARQAACERVEATYGQVAHVVQIARHIFVDEDFADVLRSQGVQTIPQTAPPAHSIRDLARHAKSGNDRLDEGALEFVMIWTFLYPLLPNPAVTDYLERNWFGFIQELKDTFITLVIEGPFPPIMSGHVGRRRGVQNLPAVALSLGATPKVRASPNKAPRLGDHKAKTVRSKHGRGTGTHSR